MTSLEVTNHAAIRMAQRALSQEDIDLIVALGTEVPDGYLVRDADANRVIEELRREIQKIERVRGKLAVVAGNKLVTAYAATRQKQRRLLRRNH